jgi:hypothetical protein
MALLAVLPACGFHSSNNDGGGDDGGGTLDTSFCYGSFVRVCFPTAPASQKVLDTIDINTDATDASSQCDQKNDQKDRYCVIAGAGFMLPGGTKITAHGSKPLVLLSTAMFDLSGNVDVSSSRSGSQPKGPGADPADCVNGTPPTVSGGGYGGSFHGKGGNGSDGKPADGSGGGAAEALTIFPSVVRGGCPGAAGTPMGVTGAGGSGGGAIAIIATQLHVEGSINASGEGGSGGSVIRSGGGGGGSGGMIVLDASMIQLGSRAKIWANGGGGAQGGATGMAGNNGNESSGPDLGAAVTSGSTDGGNGGNGAVGTMLTGAVGKSDANTGGGGGGGGGGAGFVHAQGVIDPAIISPPSLDFP